MENCNNIDVRTFGDADQALEAAIRACFNFVFSDHVMPRMDGVVLIQSLRARPDHAQVPVVMLAGTSDRAVRMKALEADPTNILTKSSCPTELKVKPRNVVTMARAVRNGQATQP